MASAVVEAMPQIDMAKTNGSDKATTMDNALAHHAATTNVVSDPVEPPVDPNHEEYQYLKLIRDILDNGEHRPDRYTQPPPPYPKSTLTHPQDRHRHSLHLRAHPPKIHPHLPQRLPHPPSPHNQARLPPRRPRRAPLVHQWLHFLTPSLRSRHQDLGRQRLASLPRQHRAYGACGG